jgi:hypothetical protein
LHREEIETLIVKSYEPLYYDRLDRIQTKRPHQRMKDFVAGCCAALNPRQWVETHASKAAEGKLLLAKACGPGDIDGYSSNRLDRKKLKKRKRGPNSQDPNPEVEARGNGDVVKEVILQPLEKKPRYEPQAETAGSDTATKNGMAASEQANRENDEIARTPGALATDTNTYSRTSKIPRDPEAFGVWFWRHRLQRAFCSDTPPKSEVQLPPFLSYFTLYTST